MISFYGGPEGPQGVRGNKGEHGKSFNINQTITVANETELKKILNDTTYQNEYKASAGQWLGIIENNILLIYQYQDNQSIKQWQHFSLGVQSQLVWTEFLNQDKSQALCLTRDNPDCDYGIGQLDFTILDGELEISMVDEFGEQQHFFFPKQYDVVESPEGYLTGKDIRFDQIGDIKLRAIEDKGILKSQGWVLLGEPVTIKRKESAAFFEDINYTKMDIAVDTAKNYDYITLSQLKQALDKYTYLINNWNAVFNKFINSKIGFDYNNNFFCNFIKLTDGLILFIYYDKDFNIQKVTEISSSIYAEAFNFWDKSTLILGNDETVGYYLTGNTMFTYSFFSDPLQVYTVHLKGINTFSIIKCEYHMGYLWIISHGNRDRYCDIYKIQKNNFLYKSFTLQAGSTIDFCIFISNKYLILKNTYEYTYVFNLDNNQITENNRIINKSYEDYAYGFSYKDNNYIITITGFIKFSNTMTGYLYRILDNGTIKFIKNITFLGNANFSGNRSLYSHFNNIINNQYLIIFGQYLSLSELEEISVPKAKLLFKNFYQTKIDADFKNIWFVGSSVVYQTKDGLKNFERDDFPPTMEEAVYTQPKISTAPYEYLKIK